MHRHAQVVEKISVIQEKVIIAETGDILRFSSTGAEVVGKAPVGRVLIDEGSLEEVEEVVIRDPGTSPKTASSSPSLPSTSKPE